MKVWFHLCILVFRKSKHFINEIFALWHNSTVAVYIGKELIRIFFRNCLFFSQKQRLIHQASIIIIIESSHIIFILSTKLWIVLGILRNFSEYVYSKNEKNVQFFYACSDAFLKIHENFLGIPEDEWRKFQSPLIFLTIFVSSD